MYIYRLVLILVISIYYFLPIIINWWIEQNSSWYQIHLLWLIAIMVIAILQLTTKPDTSS